MKFDAVEATKLGGAVRSAKNSLIDYLGKYFPKGAKAQAIIRSGQKVPTQCVIQGVIANEYRGLVSIEISGSKAKGSRRFRYVNPLDVTVLS